MGKIFCLMGKSASGKDTIYNQLLKSEELNLHNVILYTNFILAQPSEMIPTEVALAVAEPEESIETEPAPEKE